MHHIFFDEYKQVSKNYRVHPYFFEISSKDYKIHYFHFDCTSIDDLWTLDKDIHIRGALLLKLIRTVILWTLWLARNNICFNASPIPTVASVASFIIY